MAEKARTPRSGAEREAKYASKMKEKDYETWCASREKEEMHRQHERAKTGRDKEKRQGEEKRKKSS